MLQNSSKQITMSLLVRMFEDKLTSDERIPWMVVHGYGLYLPSPIFWTQLIILLVLASIFAAMIGIVMYKVVIPRRGTSTAVLIGIGVLLPTVLYFPFYLIETLDLQNRVHMMNVTTAPTVLIFKILEALSGTAPPYVEDSIGNYITYYASTLEFIMDPKTKQPEKSNGTDILWKAKDAAAVIFICSILYSICLPSDFAPFHVDIPAHSLEHSLNDIFSLNHLGNNFVAALMFQLWLMVGCEMICLAALLLGIKSKSIFDNPLLKSKSPSDFWGRRWNTLVHGHLKRGVYKPILIGGYSKSIAVLGVFLASGLFHEWNWQVIFFCHRPKLLRCYEFTAGKVTAFFCWNGFIIILESLLGHKSFFKRMSKVLPSPIITCLVLCVALPVSHLFTGDWIAGGYYHDLTVGLPMLK